MQPPTCSNWIRQHNIVKHQAISIEETSKAFQKRNTKFVVNATSGHPLESDPAEVEAYPNTTSWNSVKHGLDAFYRFSRPHTIIGTVE